MSRDEDPDSVMPSHEKEVLVKYDEEIIKQEDRIIGAFDSVFSDNTLLDKIEPLGNKLSRILIDVPEDELEDVINSILETSMNFNRGVRRELKESDADPDITKLFEQISISHGTELDRQISRKRKGDDWWSSVSTVISSKNEFTILSHELTIDMERKITVENDIRGSHILAGHIIKQTKSARNIIGVDVLENVDRSVLEDIQSDIDDILEDLDEYEEESQPESDDSEGPEYVDQ